MGLNLGVDRITKLLIEKKLLGLEEIITKTNKIVRASDGLEQFEEALNYAITLAKSYSYKILGWTSSGLVDIYPLPQEALSNS